MLGKDAAAVSTSYNIAIGAAAIVNGTNGIALGAGAIAGGTNNIAIGFTNIAPLTQGDYSLTIGNNIAPGANILANNIILSAVDTFTPTAGYTSSFYVNPVRMDGTGHSLYFNSTTKEITFSTVSGGGGGGTVISTFTTFGVSTMSFSTLIGGTNSWLSTSFIQSQSISVSSAFVSTLLTTSTIATRNIDFPFTTNIAIGSGSQVQTGGNYNVALGYGINIKNTATSNAIGIGNGINVPSQNSVNIGYYNIGTYTSGANIESNTICIGNNIGANGNTVSPSNIVFNVSDNPLGTSGVSGGLFVNPVRYNDSNVVSTLVYDSTSKEISYRDGRYFSTIYISSLTDSAGNAGGAYHVLTAGEGGGTQWVSTATNIYPGAVETHELLPLAYISTGQLVYANDSTTGGMVFDPFHAGKIFVNGGLSFSTVNTSAGAPLIYDTADSPGNDGEVLTASTSGLFWKAPLPFSTFTLPGGQSPSNNADGTYSYIFPWDGVNFSSIMIGSCISYNFSDSIAPAYGGLPLYSVGGNQDTEVPSTIAITVESEMNGPTVIAVQMLKF